MTDASDGPTGLPSAVASAWSSVMRYPSVLARRAAVVLLLSSSLVYAAGDGAPLRVSEVSVAPGLPAERWEPVLRASVEEALAQLGASDSDEELLLGIRLLALERHEREGAVVVRCRVSATLRERATGSLRATLDTTVSAEDRPTRTDAASHAAVAAAGRSAVQRAGDAARALRRER